ncbi:MAG: ATPase, T2SS/T4P/T4SS family [Candidatus Omnitrophota bacterium]
MISNIDTILAEALVESGVMTRNVMDPLLKKEGQDHGGLAAHLIQQGLISEDAILKILAAKLKLEKLEASQLGTEKSAIDKVPLKIAEYYRFLPIKIENRKMTVAVSMPFDTRTQDAVQTVVGCEIIMVLVREKDILDGIKKWYGLGAGTIEKILQAAPASDGQAAVAAEATEKVEEIEKLVEDASVIKLVNQILMDANQKRATDIHIEPYRGKVKVRYRIDGVLYNTNMPPEIKQFILAIASRIKIMANLNIIEKRLPQDGRAIVKIAGNTIDLRVSSIPTPSGESIVIRLLPMTRLFSLEKLGLSKEEIELFTKLIEKPYGIILITGPTGSGKSTTLYACLSMINTDERKIITIEDPVEYEMEGVTQIQVMSSIGLDFAKGLRSILRHDPDVIMVGEIRDLETAETAARVALTGHLVFSTLHTNDAASGVTRLVDIGVEPYLVASSVEAFVAQRLVRTICEHCKEEDKGQHDEIRVKIVKELGLPSLDAAKLYRGKGCEKCNFTGFWGRIAIFEILLVDEHIRDLIMKRLPSSDISRYAISKGMRTLRQSGWQKVIAGYTTPEEIIEVAPDEIAEIGEKVAPQPSRPEVEIPVVAPSVASGLEKRDRRFEEKRAFMRLDVKVSIRHRVLAAAEVQKRNFHVEQYGVTKNLSAGGLVFSSSEQLKIGSVIELEIELPLDQSTIRCYAKAVRVMESAEKGSYDVSLCFLDLSGADRARLAQFIREEIS